MKFLEAVLILSGMIIGVGMFGIPFSFVSVGFWLGALELLVIAGAMTWLHLLYGEVVLKTPQPHSMDFVGIRVFWDLGVPACLHCGRFHFFTRGISERVGVVKRIFLGSCGGGFGGDRYAVSPEARSVYKRRTHHPSHCFYCRSYSVFVP